MAKKKSGKKGLGLGLKIGIGVFLGVPVVGLLGWYALSAGLHVSGSSSSAEDLVMKNVASAQQAVADQISARANTEGFQLGDFDQCSAIEDQYKIAQGYVFTEFSRRELVGLKKTATDEEVQERCVIFAKVVARMEQLAHHDRHVFVCQGAEFTTDNSGKYKLIADPKGTGVLEVKNGVKTLLPIKQYRHILVGSWQVFNLGDGCVVIGMSKTGTFTFSGSVELSN
jgi:hypothetical protein